MILPEQQLWRSSQHTLRRQLQWLTRKRRRLSSQPHLQMTLQKRSVRQLQGLECCTSSNDGNLYCNACAARQSCSHDALQLAISRTDQHHATADQQDQCVLPEEAAAAAAAAASDAEAAAAAAVAVLACSRCRLDATGWIPTSAMTSQQRSKNTGGAPVRPDDS